MIGLWTWNRACQLCRYLYWAGNNETKIAFEAFRQNPRRASLCAVVTRIARTVKNLRQPPPPPPTTRKQANFIPNQSSMLSHSFSDFFFPHCTMTAVGRGPSACVCAELCSNDKQEVIVHKLFLNSKASHSWKVLYYSLSTNPHFSGCHMIWNLPCHALNLSFSKTLCKYAIYIYKRYFM